MLPRRLPRTVECLTEVSKREDLEIPQEAVVPLGPAQHLEQVRFDWHYEDVIRPVDRRRRSVARSPDFFAPCGSNATALRSRVAPGRWCVGAGQRLASWGHHPTNTL